MAEQKAISLSNLEKFKELCDQTYAKIGEGGGGGGTQLYRHSFEVNGVTIVLITTDSSGYTYGSDIQRAFVNFRIVSALCIGETNESNAIIKTSSLSVGSVSFYYMNADETTDFTEVVISRSQALTDTVTPL